MFFSFKILGCAYDVRLMLVLGDSSYPVTDSDIYFVNDHFSGVVCGLIPADNDV